MYFANPFTLSGHWFKGALHVHSTVSDGVLTPEEVTEWYRSHGYHFLALTDHRIASESRSVADGFIQLSGIEMDGIDPDVGIFHLLGLGFERAPDLSCYAANPDWVETFLDMQETIDLLRDAGAIVSVAHPYWSSEMSKDLLGRDGYFALEVYNGGCEVVNGKGFSSVHWDDLLATGRRVWAIAADDSHWQPQDPPDAGLGWVWVKAPALTRDAILAALAGGYFYASSGPQIYDLQVEGDQVRVRCSPAVVVDFVGNGPLSRRIFAPPGETLTEVSYTLPDFSSGHRRFLRYMRVACQDAEGRWAWSNPIFFDAGA